MPLTQRLRIPAVFCALAVLLCELVSHPYTTMGVVDDVTYIRTAHRLAMTGHIFYNGVETPLLGWQLYLGAAFIKLFSFSLTTVRMSTLLVAVALAFVLQRTLVRAGIHERNAAIGTLALVLSPLYLMLSVTFMTDITGFFSIVVCLYGCLRALQAATVRTTIGWLCFAVAANAVCGSSRQIAWLGVLVMVPSTLWLLRARRRIFLCGAAATLAGALFICACMRWFLQQPYDVHEHLFPTNVRVAHTLCQLIYTFLDVPLLLLPIALLFFPQIRKIRPRFIAAFSVLLLGYLFLAIYPSHLRSIFPLEPMPDSIGEWVNAVGMFGWSMLHGSSPIFLDKPTQILLTIASFGSLLGLFALLLRNRRGLPVEIDSAAISWKQLGQLLVPFTVVYVLLLVPRASTSDVHDRYLLAPLVVALICLVRYYQERIQPRMPSVSVLLVTIVAIYGIACTHNMFSLYRARVALAAELRANGVPDTAVDNGWEYNYAVELQHASHLNNAKVLVPAHAYVPTPPLPAGTCSMNAHVLTPHIHPLYGVSFDPNACYGPAHFTPAHYSRWPYSTPGTLYVVNYLPPAKP